MCPSSSANKEKSGVKEDVSGWLAAPQDTNSAQ
jgi:hypothetical protein